jgi:hypothetical protein
MAAPAAVIRLSPAERLALDCWICIAQFLDVNDIAKVPRASRALHVTYSVPGIWTDTVSTVTLHRNIGQAREWRILGEQIELNSGELIEDPDSAILQEAIEAMLGDDAVCPNLQSISLHLPYTFPVIGAIVRSMRARSSAPSIQPLKKLVLELRQLADIRKDPSAQLMELAILLPEEVEISLIEIPLCVSNQPEKYWAAIAYILFYNRTTIRFTLTGHLWSNIDSESRLYTALCMNTTIQQLTLKAPDGVSILHYRNDNTGHIGALTRMLVHPSLRHLSIADQVVRPRMYNANILPGDCTAIYFADSECFHKSTIETLHIELGRDAPHGLLRVLHGVAEMPQLQEFSMSWPAGGQPTPRRVCMERLRGFLQSSDFLETYRERPSSAFNVRRNPNESVPWSTIATLFA